MKRATTSPAEEPDQREQSAFDLMAGRTSERPIFLTKSVRVGIMLTLVTVASLVFLVFFAKQFNSGLVLANVIAFQLCFIWTCAELLDGSGDELTDDQPRGQDFTH